MSPPPARPAPTGRRAAPATSRRAPRAAAAAAKDEPDAPDRLAGVLARLPQGLILFGPDHSVVLTNPAYDRIMAGAPAHPGQSAEALIRARIAVGEYGPGDPETLLARHQAYDFSHKQTRRRHRPNGTIIENRWVPLADGGFMGVVTDITPLAGAEEALRRRNAETELLLASLPHGVMLWGPDQRLIAANPMAATLLGVPPACLTPGRRHGEMIDDLLAGGHLGGGAMARGMAEELKARDWTRPWVRHFVNAAGRFVERRSEPVPGGMSITTLTDLTEQRAAEHALRRARDAAEAASGAKSRFLATMSHELRTPLNAVIGYSEALAQESAALGGRAADYAGAINEAGRKLLDLIDTLLDVARLESGSFALAEEEIDLGRLIQTTLRQFAPAAAAGEIALGADQPQPGPPWPALLADRRRISQALHHLVSNALKFTEAGGRVSIRARWSTDGAVLTVRDTGIGIAEADLARIFDPFVQLDSRLSRRFPGAGLGLYVARALIESHGGTLHLASRRGEGTTAELRLPAHRLLPRPAAPAGA